MNIETARNRHVIVLSYDAFSEDNWEAASKLPNMAALLGNGSCSTKLTSVYPTLTYVIHTTFVTGVYPDRHGIFHNNPLQPFVEPNQQRWFWYRNDIQAPAIYDALRKHGMTSAGLLWPVSGGASITYNIPEIKAINNENQALKILKNGSPLYSIGMELKYGRIRQGIRQPQLDDFTTLCAVDTIKRKKPNLLLMHLIDLDDSKHALGTKGPHIDEVLQRMDNRIGKLMNAIEQAGIKEQTTFIIVGDHGHKDVRYKLHLNRLLFDHGLIYEKGGSLKWRAYVQAAGGSAFLHIKERDQTARQLAVELIHQAMRNEAYGIERFLGREELDRLHVDSSIAYMLEAREGYCFEDAHDKPVISDLAQHGQIYATHGYSPEKPNYTSVLLLAGNKIKTGGSIGPVEAVDLAPTIAALLDVPFGPCDGRVLHEILDSETSASLH